MSINWSVRNSLKVGELWKIVFRICAQGEVPCRPEVVTCKKTYNEDNEEENCKSDGKIANEAHNATLYGKHAQCYLVII